jgi:O-antigen/teichoic acid export membrane protein
MSIKKNTIANYVGSLYTLLIGILILPFYLDYLGSEAYGLIAFFTLVQAWMNMLDVGVTPTLGRSVAVARTRENGFSEFVKLLRSLEMLFSILSIFIFIIFFLGKEWLATQWFTVEHIEISTVTYCITIIGIIIGVRWVAGLYRSGISGMEQQVWLNKSNIIFSSIKNVGALAYLHFISADVETFFVIQLIVVVFELLVLSSKFYSLLPPGLKCGFRFYWLEVKAIIPFAIGIAYTSWLWIVVTQLDKLLLSKVLTLSEFGYYSLVALVAGAIGQLSGPVKGAILPRMTMFLQSNELKKFKDLYCNASQFVAVIVFSVTAVIACFGDVLLYSWTGNLDLSIWGYKILTLLVVGNAILAIEAMLYHMQFAFGKLKLHAIGSTISGCIQIPIIYFSVVYYGAEGAAIAWCSFRLCYFIFWTAYVHSLFLPNIHFKWLFPLLGTALSVGCVSLALKHVVTFSENRIFSFFQLMLVGLVVLSMAVISSPMMKKYISNKFFNKDEIEQ